MQPITAMSLNKIKGIDARCIYDQSSSNAQINKYCIKINRTSRNQKISSFWYAISYFHKIKKWIEWADVLHYVYIPGDKFNRDLAYAHKLNKKIFIEFVGSDIRFSSKLIALNPYYKSVFNSGLYEYKDVELKNEDKKLQRLFARYKAIPLLNEEMSIFLDKKLFPNHFLLRIRINVHDFKHSFALSSKNENKKIRILHSPSRIYAKGTNIIIPIIEKLKKQYDIEFLMLNNVSRENVLENMKNSDIFIDQLIIGSYGMAAIEAMAIGKPTLCYIMPEVIKNGIPDDCPIVNVNPETLEEKLIELIENPEIRHEIGIKSRIYVEKYHDADKLALKLLDIYNA